MQGKPKGERVLEGLEIPEQLICVVLAHTGEKLKRSRNSLSAGQLPLSLAAHLLDLSSQVRGAPVHGYHREIM